MIDSRLAMFLLLAQTAAHPAKKLPTPPLVTSTAIEIYRPGRFTCSGPTFNIPVIIDDKEVGRIQSGRFLTVPVAPGSHTVRGVETPLLQVEVEADQVAFIRVRYDDVGTFCQQGGVGLAVMAPDEAQHDLAGLKPADAKYIYTIEAAMPTTAPAPVHSASPAPQDSGASGEPSTFNKVRASIEETVRDHSCDATQDVQATADALEFTGILNTGGAFGVFIARNGRFAIAYKDIELVDAGVINARDCKRAGGSKQYRVLITLASRKPSKWVEMGFDSEDQRRKFATELKWMTTYGVVEAEVDHPEPENKREDLPSPAVPVAPLASGGTPNRRALENRGTTPKPSIYDTATPFNVLDKVYQDQKTGQVTLFGHVDNRYSGPPIPYFLHLGVLLANPRPEFTLDWTPETERSLAGFLRRLDSEDERRKAVDQWTNFYDSQHRVTEIGGQMLRSMGVNPTLNGGGAPGYLGLELADGTADKSVNIRRVISGSPAERAGIQAGQSIISAMFVEPGENFQNAHSAPGLWAGVIDHSVLEAGEGATAIICVEGRQNCYSVVLGASQVNPWADMSTQDVTEALFRSAGMRRAATAVEALALFQRTPGATMAAVSAMWNVLDIGDDERDEISNRVRSGVLNNQQAVGVVFRRICRDFDDRLETGGSLVAAYDQTVARGGSTVDGGNACFGLIPQAAQPLQRRAIDQLLGRPGGFRIDPQLIQGTFGVRPEVAPRFIGVDAHSLLAKMMEDADVLGKSLIDRPELARRFPSYQTWHQYGDAHGLLKDGSYHMWISPGKIVAAQSSDGSTLEIRSFAMRMNVRETDSTGHDIPQSQSGYEELLSSLYEPLSADYPVLHEVAEAAKLSLVAEWLRTRQPGLTFPEAQENWNTPERLPGYLYVYLRAIGTSDRFDTTIIPAGGIALSPFPQGNSDVKLTDTIASDSSVVDLRDADALKGLIDPSDHAVAIPDSGAQVWTGQSTGGGSAVAAISVRLHPVETAVASLGPSQALGSAVIDCAATPALLKRLGQGLSVERDAIRREEALLAQVDGGPIGGQQNQQDAVKDTLNGLTGLVTDFLLDWAPLDKSLEVQGVDLATRQKLESRYESIRASAEAVANNLEGLKKPGIEGYKYGSDIQKDAYTLKELAQRLSNFLNDSGLSDAAGKELMQQFAKQLITRGAIEEGAAAMPLAGLVFVASELAIDAGTIAYQWHLDNAERDVVRRDLDTMRTAYDQLDQRMTSLSLLMAENCVSTSHQ